MRKKLYFVGLAFGATAFLAASFSGREEQQNDNLVMRVNESMAGDDVIIDINEKRKFLNEIGIKIPIDATESVSLVSMKEGIYNVYFQNGNYGRNTGIGKNGYAGQVSSNSLEAFIKKNK